MRHRQPADLSMNDRVPGGFRAEILRGGDPLPVSPPPLPIGSTFTWVKRAFPIDDASSPLRVFESEPIGRIIPFIGFAMVASFWKEAGRRFKFQVRSLRPGPMRIEWRLLWGERIAPHELLILFRLPGEGLVRSIRERIVR